MRSAATAARVLLAIGLVGSMGVHSGTMPEPVERVACPPPAGGPDSGVVVVRARIDTDGRVDSCDVAKSARGLDDAAVACVRRWRFTPAKDDSGKSIAVWYAVQVRFGDPEAVPEAIRKVPPRYPDAARDARISGLVVIEALVDREGRVVRTRVKTSVPGLDDAAIESVTQYRFRPAQVDGRPVAMWVDVPTRFTIH